VKIEGAASAAPSIERSRSQQRFLSEDPIGFAGGDTNLFAYAGNDPVNSTDPSGLQAVVPGGGVGAAVGAGAFGAAAQDAASTTSSRRPENCNIYALKLDRVRLAFTGDNGPELSTDGFQPGRESWRKRRWRRRGPRLKVTMRKVQHLRLRSTANN
jgi:hypothetical protein